MIISISGRIGSGKDTVGKIVQYLKDKKLMGYTHPSTELDFKSYIDNGYSKKSIYEIKKYATKVKQIASLLLGVNSSMFEDREFKKSKLGPEWDNMTVREFLQKLGTDSMRMGLHENIWANALFADYKPRGVRVPTGGTPIWKEYPNWIITDTRFPNELKAVEERNGVTIKVVRPETDHLAGDHLSETALDNATFDYVIVNDGSIQELIKEVEEVLIEEGII